jgi:hypothetical protein
VVRALLSLLLLSSAACTLSNPFGVECVSDQNCGCANCCIAYRCTSVGPLMGDAGTSADAGADAGEATDAGPLVWKVTTLAGSTRGRMDGLGAAAQFDAPTGIAMDSSGVLYVADSNNNCVRRIDSDGVVSTLAPALLPCGGTGLATPQGVAVDGAGNVYVASTAQNCVKMITTSGTVEIVGGSCSQQSSECMNTPNPPRFSQPSGLAFADPFLFVTEITANHVRWINLRDRSAGVLAGQGFGTAVISDGTCGFNSQCLGGPSGAKFNGPGGIAAGAAGVLFVTDIYNCALRRVVTQPGCGVTTLGRTGCPMFVNEDTRGILRNPFGVAVGRGPLAGRAVVADTGNNRVALVDEAGRITPIAGTGMKGFADGLGAEAQFQFPSGVAVDAQGRVFVADSSNHRIRVLKLEAP